MRPTPSSQFGADAGSVPAIILDQLPHSVLAFDSDWRAIYVNAALASRLGHPASELIGTHFDDLIPGAELSFHREQCRKVLEDGHPAHFEAPSPNSGVWVQVGVYPMPGGVIVFVRDARPEKETRDALARTEAYLETAPVGIVVLDRAYRIQKLNQAMERLAGRTAESLIGTSLYDLVVPEDAHVIEGVWAQRVAGDRGPIDLESAIHFPEGKRPVRTRSVPIIEDGEWVGTHVVVVDLSDLRRTEEQLRRKDQELHHSQKIDAIGRLAGGIAHDAVPAWTRRRGSGSSSPFSPRRSRGRGRASDSPLSTRGCDRPAADGRPDARDERREARRACPRAPTPTPGALHLRVLTGGARRPPDPGDGAAPGEALPPRRAPQDGALGAGLRVRRLGPATHQGVASRAAPG